MSVNFTSAIARALAVSALAWGLVLPGVAGAQASSTAAQTSAADGVTVKVTPTNISPQADTWTFAVVLDTHSQDLSDDLMSGAVLVGADGREFKPLSWQGAPAGGHHREGTLEFAALKPLPKSIVLMLRRPGERERRSFYWAM